VFVCFSLNSHGENHRALKHYCMNCVTSSFIKNLAINIVFTVDRQINCVDFCIEICNFRICFLINVLLSE
jgi:hypothetical protein